MCIALYDSPEKKGVKSRPRKIPGGVFQESLTIATLGGIKLLRHSITRRFAITHLFPFHRLKVREYRFSILRW